MPAARRRCAEHLGVEVGAAVAQDLVEGVEIVVAPRVGEVDPGEHHLCAIGAGGTGERPAGVADDDTPAEEGLAALGADAVGGRTSMEFTCAAHRQDACHHRQALRLLPHRDQVGRNAEEIGALQRRQAKDLREPDVVADGDGDAAEIGAEDGYAEIARLEEQVLRRPKMVLAVLADETLRPSTTAAL